jgi:tetratricopeptide (TPR) repeat protein
MNVMYSTTAVRRLLGISLAVMLAATAVCPPAVAVLLQPDDPFADELNPFGTGKPPAQAPLPPKPEPEAEPGPEAKPEPGPEAEPEAKPTVEPQRPAARAQPDKPRDRLPVPFPDTAEPEEAVAPRGRAAGREDRPMFRDRQFEPRAGADGLQRDRGFGFDEPAAEPTEAEKKLIEAEQLERQGKLDESRDALREVVKLDPMLTMGHLALGVVLRRLEDYRGSVEACTKGIEVDPEEPELYLRRGISWFHLGLYGIALEDFEEAAGMAYDDPRPELWRGLTLIELDRPLEAINAYASAIRRDRTCMLAYLNRGLAYLATDQPRKAEFDFNQAIRQKPKDVRAWSSRGVAQARQGRYREAIESYETALGISPNDKPARVNLEAARRMAGQERQQRSR